MTLFFFIWQQYIYGGKCALWQHHAVGKLYIRGVRHMVCGLIWPVKMLPLACWAMDGQPEVGEGWRRGMAHCVFWHSWPWLWVLNLACSPMAMSGPPHCHHDGHSSCPCAPGCIWPVGSPAIWIQARAPDELFLGRGLNYHLTNQSF